MDDWKANNPQYLSKKRLDTMWSYFYCFNFNPTYDASYKPEDWLKAVNNENFRHSIMSAFDRAYAIRAFEPDDPESILQNTITPETFCSDGTTDFSREPALADNEAKDLFFNADKALEYKKAAMEELSAQGVTFPITMVMTYKSGDSDWENEYILAKQQIESVLGTDYVVCELYAGPSESFLSETRRAGKYSFMRCNWGADYIDPQTWTDPFDGKDNLDPDTGKCIGNSYNRMDAYYYDPDKTTLFPETNAILTEYYTKVEEPNRLRRSCVCPWSATGSSWSRRRISSSSMRWSCRTTFRPPRMWRPRSTSLKASTARPASPACASRARRFRITSSIWMNIRRTTTLGWL